MDTIQYEHVAVVLSGDVRMSDETSYNGTVQAI